MISKMSIPSKINDLFNKLGLIKPKDKDDDDQNFIKQDDTQIVPPEETTEPGIKPKNNKTRGLDTEVGGLEDKEQQGGSSKDAWDDRSEEVDEMGTSDVFNTTGMRSVIWKKKKRKLNNQKLEEKYGDIENMSHADRVSYQKESNKNGGKSR